MEIKTFYFNPYRECTYVLYHEGHKEAVIIDCGAYSEREQARLKEFISTQGLLPVAHLITHAHPDHICGADFIEQEYKLKPQMHLPEGTLDLPQFPHTHIAVIATPGHKEDCVCFYLPQENILFSGDTLFQEAIGRTDLAGGDMPTLIRSLKKLAELPDETKVYPGHGYTTTIAHEKEYNPYF